MICASLHRDLHIRHENGKPIIFGLVGAGQMGTDIIVQASLMNGVRIGAVSSKHFDSVQKAIVTAGYSSTDAVEVNTVDSIDSIIESGRIAVVDDFVVLSRSGLVDVVIDATGSPEFGANVAFESVHNGKHIVLLNVETDVTIGRAVRKWAESAGVVYTGAAGDEPAATVSLVRFAETMCMDVVAAGKGKNNPLNVSSVPDDCLVEARARGMNPRMLVEFIDGTKTQVEMTALANATALTVDVPGMHGVCAKLSTLADVLCPIEDGGLLGRSGVVDYVIGGDVAPGVFVIVRPRNERVIKRMIDLKVGKGSYFSLVRPFHLTSLEVPLSAARAVLYGIADMQMLSIPYVECCAVAKRTLNIGEKLGRIGMDAYRGFAVSYPEACARKLVPIGLCEGAKIKEQVLYGEFITYNNTVPDNSLMITKVRKGLDKGLDV